MTVVAIIQARMGSTRLPGKVLANVEGLPLLAWVHERAVAVERVDEVVIATSVVDADDVVVEACRERGWTSFRGSEDDVLDRFYRAGHEAAADHIMRITADCPLLCPMEAGRVVARHLATGADYTHNITAWGSGMPLGTGVEIFTFAALEESWREGQAPHHREHVDEYIGDNRDRFHMERVSAPALLARPDLRLTVDTAEDLALVRSIYKALLPDDRLIPLSTVIRHLDRHPELLNLNRHIVQKTL